MKSFLPLRIGNRIKKIGIGTLGNRQSWYDPSFISGNTLFSFKKNFKLLSSKENMSKVEFKVVSESRKIVNSHYIYSVRIVINNKEENDVRKEVKYFEIIEVNGDKTLKFTEDIFRNQKHWNEKHWVGIDITFEYEGSTGKCLIIQGVDEKIFGNINIDLGSESTQMTKVNNSVDHIDIIEKLSKKTGLSDKSRNTIYQKDNDNEDFYVTGKILLKKKGGKLKHFNSDDNLFKMLSLYGDMSKSEGRRSFDTWETDRDNIISISNPKLLHLIPKLFQSISLDGNEKLDLEIYYRQLFSAFVQLAIEEEKYFFEESRNHRIFNRIVLLIPNAFNQETVSGIIKALNEFINKSFIEDYFLPHKKDILKKPHCIEIFTLSESDAAIIGLENVKKSFPSVINKQIDLNDKTILVIDSGRGTTDFSIMEFGENGQSICKKRGGIIGAGQYVSNAFIKSLLCMYYVNNGKSEAELKKAYEYIVTLKNAADISTFHSLIEKAKRNQRSEDKISENIELLKTMMSTPGFDAKDQSFYLNNENSIISNDLSQLSEIIVKKITNAKSIYNINYIYFTGRNFLFKPFKDILEAELKKYVKNKWYSKFLFNFNNTKYLSPKSNDAYKIVPVQLNKITSYSSNANSNLVTTGEDDVIDVLINGRENTNENSEGNIIHYLGEQNEFSEGIIIGEDLKTFDDTTFNPGLDYIKNQSIFGPGVKLDDNFKDQFISEIINSSKHCSEKETQHVQKKTESTSNKGNILTQKSTNQFKEVDTPKQEKPTKKSKSRYVWFSLLILLIAVSPYFIDKIFPLNKSEVVINEDSKKKRLVLKFFDFINSKNYESAYEMQTNKIWTPMSKFMSSWSGFSEIIINETKLNSGASTNEESLFVSFAAKNTAGIIIERLNLFEFDNNNPEKISRLRFFPDSLDIPIRQTSAKKTIERFFDYCSKLNFRKAHYFQKISNWGNIEKFASKEGWGGNVEMKLKEVNYKQKCKHNHDVFHVKYYENDPTNGNIGDKEYFYHLDLVNQEFKIVKANTTLNGTCN